MNLDKEKVVIYMLPLVFGCGNNSVVECNLAKVKVAGSNPVSRSIFFLSHSNHSAK